VASAPFWPSPEVEARPEANVHPVSGAENVSVNVPDEGAVVVVVGAREDVVGAVVVVVLAVVVVVTGGAAVVVVAAVVVGANVVVVVGATVVVVVGAVVVVVGATVVVVDGSSVVVVVASVVVVVVTGVPPGQVAGTSSTSSIVHTSLSRFMRMIFASRETGASSPQRRRATAIADVSPACTNTRAMSAESSSATGPPSDWAMTAAPPTRPTTAREAARIRRYMVIPSGSHRA
jgi:hypothetical protein